VTGVTPPVNIYPVAESYLNIGKETGGYAVPATSYVSIPVATGYVADNKPTPLEDTGLRGGMVKVYDLQYGSITAEHTIPESPCYGDTIGHVFMNMFGDLTTTGTASTPTWTTSSALTAGATAIPVTTGTAATAGTFVQIDTATNSEVVIVGTGSTTTSIAVSAATPVRFNHLSGVAVVSVVAPFTHTFNTLNLASSTGSTSAQPPSHTLVHRNGLAGPGNYNADLYAYTCFSELTITGKSSGWMVWEAKATSFGKAAPASVVGASFSQVRGWPSWMSTNTIGGTATNDISEWSCTFTRDMDVIPTADGQQNPYVIGRGPIAATFKLTYDPALDESALNYMLNNTKPTLAWSVSNGLTGASQIAMSIAAQLGAYKTATLKADKSFYGYDVTGDLLGSTVNTGNSGGFGPATLTLTNSTPTY
jgi:hypothetical protein